MAKIMPAFCNQKSQLYSIGPRSQIPGFWQKTVFKDASQKSWSNPFMLNDCTSIKKFLQIFVF